MKRLVLISTLALALALPLAAVGKVVQLGEADPALPTSKCPGDPCVAAYQMTGYQEMAKGSKERPYAIRRDGRIVALTVKLGRLTDEQVDFFDRRFGDPPSVRVSILRRGKKRSRRHDHRLLAQSEVIPVADYLGSSPTFVLDEPLRVKRGSIVALTVPTWAPVLAPEQERADYWRSSRLRNRCGTAQESAPRSAQQRVGRLRTWGCNYRSERLLYTVTYIPDNRPTSR